MASKVRDIALVAGRGGGDKMRMRCLLVEDDRTTRTRLEAMVRLLGWDAQVVGDLARAQAAVRDTALRWDVVVTDYYLGLEEADVLLAEMRSTPRLTAVPAVVISSAAHEAHVQRVLRYPGVVLAAKPLDPLRLRELMRGVVDVGAAEAGW